MGTGVNPCTVNVVGVQGGLGGKELAKWPWAGQGLRDGGLFEVYELVARISVQGQTHAL